MEAEAYANALPAGCDYVRNIISTTHQDWIARGLELCLKRVITGQNSCFPESEKRVYQTETEEHVNPSQEDLESLHFHNESELSDASNPGKTKDVEEWCSRWFAVQTGEFV